jgi:hypothetical protein
VTKHASWLAERVVDLHLVPLKQRSGGVIDGHQRHLVTDLRLHEGHLRLRELGLGLEHKIDLLRTELVLSLLGIRRLLREIASDLGRRDGEFGLLQAVHGVSDVEVHGLILAPHLVKVVALRDRRLAQGRARAAIPYRQVQREPDAVGGIAEVKELRERVPESARDHHRGGHQRVVLNAADALRAVESLQLQVGQQGVVSQADVDVVGGQLLAQARELRPVLAGLGR